MQNNLSLKDSSQKMATVNIHCMKKITSFVFHTRKKIIFLVTYSFNCSKNDTWPPVAYIFYILRQLDGQLDKSMCPENKQRGPSASHYGVAENSMRGRNWPAVKCVSAENKTHESTRVEIFTETLISRKTPEICRGSMRTQKTKAFRITHYWSRKPLAS